MRKRRNSGKFNKRIRRWKSPTKWVVFGLAMGVVLATVGSVGALNGWFGGGGSIPSDTMTRGLVGYWAFEEGSGITAYDASGNGNNGTWAGTGSHWADGKVGGAGQFNGVDDYVDCGSDSSIDDISVITIEAWINPKDWGNHPDYGYARIVDKVQKIFYLTNNESGYNSTLKFYYVFSTSFGSWFAETNSLQLNTWQHVAVVYDNSSTANTPTFYVNGVQKKATVGTPPQGTASSDAASSLRIGNTATPARAFNGLIDDVRIYNYARTPEEIRLDYNAGLSTHFK